LAEGGRGLFQSILWAVMWRLGKTMKYLSQELVSQPRFKPDMPQMEEQCVSSAQSQTSRFHDLNPNNSM